MELFADEKYEVEKNRVVMILQSKEGPVELEELVEEYKKMGCGAENVKNISKIKQETLFEFRVDRKTVTKCSQQLAMDDSGFYEEILLTNADLQNNSPSSPIKGLHMIMKNCMWGTVAVAYDIGFFIGQVTSAQSAESICVNVLKHCKDGTYKWQKAKGNGYF
ncbi:hypothetical protein ACROYT_G015291 [Oculina patagonica]